MEGDIYMENQRKILAQLHLTTKL